MKDASRECKARLFASHNRRECEQLNRELSDNKRSATEANDLIMAAMQRRLDDHHVTTAAKKAENPLARLGPLPALARKRGHAQTEQLAIRKKQRTGTGPSVIAVGQVNAVCLHGPPPPDLIGANNNYSVAKTTVSTRGSQGSTTLPNACAVALALPPRQSLVRKRGHAETEQLPIQKKQRAGPGPSAIAIGEVNAVYLHWAPRPRHIATNGNGNAANFKVSTRASEFVINTA